MGMEHDVGTDVIGYTMTWDGVVLAWHCLAWHGIDMAWHSMPWYGLVKVLIWHGIDTASSR